MPSHRQNQPFSRQNSALGLYVTAWHGQIVSLDLDLALHASLDLTHALSAYQSWQMRPKMHKCLPPSIAETPLAELCDMGGEGEAILCIPSLINGPEVLDITPTDSLLSSLKTAGFHIYLLNWKRPNVGERHGVDDFLSAIRVLSGFIPNEKIGALGYCLGGTLLHLAACEIPKIKAMTLLGAPWNFHHEETLMGRWALSFRGQNLNQILDATELYFGLLPSTAVDHFFALLNPLQFVEKFRNQPAGPKGNAKFDATEDWLTTGRDLDMGLARVLILEWMAQNHLMTLRLRHQIPSLLVEGVKDHIAPPASCSPMRFTMANCHEVLHPSGHMGMLIGKSAQEKIWPEIAKFHQFHLAQ